MRVIHLSYSDCSGGAAIAAHRLHVGLRACQIDSHMLVQTQVTSEAHIHVPKSKQERVISKFRSSLDRLPQLPYRQRQPAVYSCNWFPSSIPSEVEKYHPDIINLHWIGDGYLRIEGLAKLQCPLVWTLHDMWAFTGGCHYNGDCEHYLNSCGECPQLGSKSQWDLSRWIWWRKSKAYSMPMVVVCPSRWLAQCARSSSLFQEANIKIIPYGLDCQQYRPINRNVARQILNLPPQKQLILFGAATATGDPRKGFHLLQPALQKLKAEGWANQAELLVFGALEPAVPIDLGLPVHYLGHLHDSISLTLVYNAADVFVAPSVQDNLPNTVLEANACGIPCVAFNIGGLPDMIDHQLNGYLAAPFSPEDLARGIAWVLEDQERHIKLSENARLKAEHEFTLEKQALNYQTLYEAILS